MLNLQHIISRVASAFCAFFLLTVFVLAAPARSQGIDEIVSEFSSYGDRSSGTEGSARAASFILEYMSGLGLSPEIYHFPIPVRDRRKSEFCWRRFRDASEREAE